jgi:hypothetical protein
MLRHSRVVRISSRHATSIGFAAQGIVRSESGSRPSYRLPQPRIHSSAPRDRVDDDAAAIQNAGVAQRVREDVHPRLFPPARNSAIFAHLQNSAAWLRCARRSATAH